MGKKVYKNFKDNDLTTIKTIVSNASAALSKAYAARVKNTDVTAFKDWFGVGDKDKVKGIIHRMNYAMLNGKVEIKYLIGGDCAGGVNAVAYAPAHGWNKASVSQAKEKSSNFTMAICPRMLKIMASLGSSKQSQVGTFLHELSHLLGGTDDVVDPDTQQVAYDSKAAKALAKNHPDKAIKNAENYGFYISSFLVK